MEKDKLLPQPIVVENKPGGSGGIAFAYVAGKKKDPYYLVTAVTSFLTTPLMGLTPVGLKDFTPVANFAFDEYMLMVEPQLQVQIGEGDHAISPRPIPRRSPSAERSSAPPTRSAPI